MPPPTPPQGEHTTDPASRATLDASEFGPVSSVTITESGWTIAFERGRIRLSLDQFDSLRRTLGRAGSR